MNEPERMLSLASEDLEMVSPGQDPVTGPQARHLLRGFFDQFTVAVHSSTGEVVVSGDWAFRRYSYELTLTPRAGGASSSNTGHGIHILRRQDDGSWKVAKDIWN
jgi:ketosteroid isomerase-like protein